MSGNTWTISLPTGLTQHYYSQNTRFEGGGQVFAVTFVAGSLLQAGTVAGGSPGVVAAFGAAGEQTGVFLKRGLLNGWTLLSQGVGNDFNIGRWNDAGTFQGNALSLTRAGAIGFNNVTPIAKPTISGSRGGNAALASLLTQLAAYGLVTDGSSA